MRLTDNRVAAVVSIYDSTAQMIDRSTGSPFELQLSAPGGVNPMVGELWLVSRLNGYWEFERRLSRSAAPPQRTFAESMQVLSERGLIDPSYADGDDEVMQLAFIGELRWFTVPPNDHWVAAGSLVDRLAYRELAMKIDPFVPGVDDPAVYWATPLQVPSAPAFGDDGAVHPYFCARK